MASRRVDAVLLTDSNALLCGILTDKVSFCLSFYDIKLVKIGGSCDVFLHMEFASLQISLKTLLCFKDIATRVIAEELNLEETPVSKVMTKNPVFVLADTLAVEALQKMVQGKNFKNLFM